MKPEKTIPFLCEKDWGGTRLRNFGKSLSSPHTGESWELSAHPNGECSVYGLPLSKAFAQYGQALAGRLAARGDFPLLIKLIDARETLSVQVHPDDALAEKLFGEPYGKTEAWVILDAPPGATLILGTDTDSSGMRAAIAEGHMDEHLKRIPVKAGDCIYIPAGTVHAIEKGILLYEVQQSSDRTFRLYAWGRDAALHIEESLLAMEIPVQGAGLIRPKQIPAKGGECLRLIECPAFTLDRLHVRHIMEETADGSRFYAYTALTPGELRHPECTIQYNMGDTILIPASAGRYTLHGGTLLKAYPTGD